MADRMKQRFLKLLDKDLATLREAAAAWELEKHNARLEDLNGKMIASATRMKENYRTRERELLELIEKAKRI